MTHCGVILPALFKSILERAAFCCRPQLGLRAAPAEVLPGGVTDDSSCPDFKGDVPTEHTSGVWNRIIQL